jgi:hypothetical protein
MYSDECEGDERCERRRTRRFSLVQAYYTVTAPVRVGTAPGQRIELP